MPPAHDRELPLIGWTAPSMSILCKHQLEHKGGCAWCCQPVDHEGPHDPLPTGRQKRQHAAPTKLEDEQPRPQWKSVAKKPKIAPSSVLFPSAAQNPPSSDRSAPVARAPDPERPWARMAFRAPMPGFGRGMGGMVIRGGGRSGRGGARGGPAFAAASPAGSSKAFAPHSRREPLDDAAPSWRWLPPPRAPPPAAAKTPAAAKAPPPPPPPPPPPKPPPVFLCKHQLEHKGGRWWCEQPMGHAGPHDPLPHEGAGIGKRARGDSRKKLGDEEEGPQWKPAPPPKPKPAARPTSTAEEPPSMHVRMRLALPSSVPVRHQTVGDSTHCERRAGGSGDEGSGGEGSGSEAGDGVMERDAAAALARAGLDSDLHDTSGLPAPPAVGFCNKSGKVLMWSEEEDATILRAVDLYGHQWAKIARMLPDPTAARSGNAVRNRWYRMLDSAEKGTLHETNQLAAREAAAREATARVAAAREAAAKATAQAAAEEAATEAAETEEADDGAFAASSMAEQQQEQEQQEQQEQQQQQHNRARLQESSR
jgi:hypothetical protein